MEDDMAIVGNLQGKEDLDFVGVFDGHGGREVSSFAAKTLPTLVAQNLETTGNPEESLKSSFFELNEQVKQRALSGGTTAIVALFLKDRFYIGNAGDSRSVLCLQDKAVRLSNDHKPDDPTEEARIKKAGGHVTKQTNKQGKTISRLNGMLAVSRALGDTFLLPVVTPEPDIKCVEFSTEQRMLILACDGVWDVLSDDEAMTIALEAEDPEQAAVRLRDIALQKSSTDNISVIVVQLPPLNFESPRVPPAQTKIDPPIPIQEPTSKPSRPISSPIFPLHIWILLGFGIFFLLNTFGIFQ